MKERYVDAALAVASLLLCAAAAWSVSQFSWDNSHRLILPFVFLGFVLFLGFRYGRAVGMVGTIISGMIFAFALYRPLGSFSVADASARSALAWAVLIGVSISFLVLPTRDDLHHRNK